MSAGRFALQAAEPVGEPAVCRGVMKSSISDPKRAHGPFRGAYALIACGAGILLAGCVTEPESRVLSSPPPPAPRNTVSGTAMQPTTVTTVPNVAVVGAPGTTTTTTTSADGITRQQTVVVNQPLPVLQQEVVLARPSAQHLWIPGYWTWQNNRYEWMAGHWEVPPFSGATWVASRSEPANGAYRFYEGYWR